MLESHIRQEAHDERVAKEDEFVTKSWDELDSIDIIDSINSGDLEPLVDALRSEDQWRDNVGEAVYDILDAHFRMVAKGEL